MCVWLAGANDERRGGGCAGGDFGRGAGWGRPSAARARRRVHDLGASGHDCRQPGAFESFHLRGTRCEWVRGAVDAFRGMSGEVASSLVRACVPRHVCCCDGSACGCLRSE